MLDKNLMVKVTNRDSGTAGYIIPELNNLRRTFAPHETKEISMGELRSLSYIPGGLVMIEEYFIIDNKDAVKELLNKEVEPEYYYTEKEITELLLHGSLDQLLDCLDFAPTGVIELVKSLAVSLEINDISKRNAILEKTGFNVTKAIEINHETSENSVDIVKTRRTAPITQKNTTVERRTTPTSTSKYNVTKIAKK